MADGKTRQTQLRRVAPIVGLVLALGATCEPTSRSRADDPAPAAPPATSAPSGIDPSIAALGPTVEAAAQAIADGRFDDARAAIASAPTDEACIIRYRLARAYGAAGSADAAIPLLEDVIDADGPLALAARVELGHQASDPAVARAAVEPACQTDWPGQAEACAVLALASAGLPEEDARLETALSHASALSFDVRARITIALAEHLGASDVLEDRERAIELLRALGDLRPSSSVTSDVDARATALVETLPPPRRRALRELGSAHALARAEAFARSNAHADARRAFHAIAESTHRTDPAHCAAMLGEGRSMYRARERALAAERLDATVSICARDTDVLAWALYFAAKSYSALGQDALAVARYDALAERVPDHRLVDDAHYEAAAIELRAGDLDAARAHLRRVVDGPADADMRPEALFLLGWTERQAGALEAARTAFEEALGEGSTETREDLGGRLAYWRARTLADLGRADEARDAFDALSRARPLSYYGRHARGRLVELGASADTEPTPETPLTFSERSETASPGFQRALACMRAGDVPLAEQELDALGLTSTSDDEDGRWLVVSLLSRAGASERAVSRTRGRLVRALLGRPIDARARALFALAYPRGYADVVESGARDAEIPSALVFGLIREESSFSAGAVSIAHAYGLMQLIRPTARRLARPLGLPSDPAALVRPDINVRLGTRYLAELNDHYTAGPEMIPAAYNAGQGAVDRWLRERGDRPLDEFVETIPYAETRGYTRRVIQSWGVYAFLETGRVEPLGRALPTL